MSETNKGKQLFTVARVFFLLIVIPLSLMAILIANGIFAATAGSRSITAATLAVDTSELGRTGCFRWAHGLDPLTRRAPADENAGCAPPSPPRGRGKKYFWFCVRLRQTSSGWI